MKYPYIPKEYYAATMFACKLIRQHHDFNRGINASAKYYGVDRQELAKHVRARQGAGQKGSKRGNYKYYALAYMVATDYYTDYGLDVTPTHFEAIKATSLTNAKNQIRKRHDDGRVYPFIAKDKEFDTLEEAQRQCAEWYDEA